MVTHNNIVDFLASIEVPKLSSKVDSGLISEAEVLTAIAKLKAGKSPGTDGLTAAFYKKFAEHLVPLLTNCFNKAFITRHLTPTQHLVIIVLLFKKEDTLGIGNYRPILIDQC